MAIWIFGDSFAMDHQDSQQWQHQLARHYNTDVLIDAYYGFSNERIFMSVENNSVNFKPDDWIIVTPTQENRHWFFSFRLSSYEYQLTDSLPYDS